MKIAFTGDVVLQEVENSPEFIFGDLKNLVDINGYKLCINLESPFISSSSISIKNKITLKAEINKINYLTYLNPSLINLANNHINDYGNESVELTFKLLNENNLKYWGVGFSNEKKNVIVDQPNKIIHLAFTDRSSDFTGSPLFGTVDFLGPYAPDIKMVSEIRKMYPKYIIVINIHWGIEDIKLPEPQKRMLAYNLIDAGGDVIIGHHAHIIQPIERYKDKLIFYSLGNMYFKDINYSLENKNFVKKAKKHQKFGIIPVLNFSNKKVYLEKVITIKINRENKIEIISKKKTNYINSYSKLYPFIFRLYSLSFLILNKLILYYKDPILIIKFFQNRLKK